MGTDLAAIWDRIIVDAADKCWVVFSHGTCVVLMAPEGDLSAQAIALMKEWGPVQAGTPAGDFTTITLSEAPGWVITSHHDDIITYVGPDEVDSDADDYVIGLAGRTKRDEDAKALEIVHVKDNRETGG